MLEAPGKYDVDVVVGTTQRFGIPLGYGGPHAAYFATKEAYKRNIPGRIIGQTRDMEGKPALRMALQTREQHIKEMCNFKYLYSTSITCGYGGNVCGLSRPEGLKNIALEIHEKAKDLRLLLIA